MNFSSVRVFFHFLELFKIAGSYGEVDLKDRCVQQLKLLTTVNNVCDVYSEAVQLQVFNAFLHAQSVVRNCISLFHAVSNPWFYYAPF